MTMDELKAKFQHQITRCDERIQSYIDESNDWNDRRICKEISHRAGILCGARQIGWLSRDFDLIDWTKRIQAK